MLPSFIYACGRLHRCTYSDAFTTHSTIMPPKGWRKNAEGKFPLNPKDLELVSIDEILFPKSTIAKLTKAITTSDNNDSNMMVSKDSLVAVQRSATVFVSHLMFHARKIAKDADRKNVTAQDILQGLEKADLSGFVPEVKQKLATYEQQAELKKKLRAEKKAGDEPATKKLKDNDMQLVVPSHGEDSDDNENDQTEEQNYNDAEADHSADEAEDNEPSSASNPIALLGQEETELEGEKEDKEDTIEKADSSDAEGDDQ